jgi:beta-lactamase regulating signal transducer with metallopeptidase domain
MAAEELIARSAELLWTGALAATPLALVVAAVSRWRRVRPATRHMLWVGVLASFITPAIGTLVWRPQWFRSDRVLAAADSVLAEQEADGAPPAPVAEPFKPSIEHAASRERIATAAPVITSPLYAAPGRHLTLLGSSSLAADQPPATHLIPDPAQLFVGPVCPPMTSASAVPAFQSSVPAVVTVSESFVGPLPLLSSMDLAPVAPAGVEPPVTVAAAKPAPVAVELAAARPAARPSQASSHKPVGSLRPWLLRVLSVRDAVADLPPIPLPVWFGGVVLVVMLSVWRRCLGMLWLRRATPAGPHVQALVRQVGGTLGLSRTPRVVFVDAAVSPMIWCGLRPLLVLPTTLWRTLDEDSRRAVLVHELAHVRRWDHLLCWVTAAIGALYWWHPVVWWARRKLHEEAEASCDAWVTNLFPGERRAYASALVVATSFVSSRAETRGPWLGVASGSAKRLARRITMVMTHKAAPRVSMLGLCVTALVIATGTFVMPSLACPPDDEETKAKSTHVKPAVAPVAKQKNKTPKAAGQDVTFFGEAPALEAMKERPQVAPVPPTPPTAPTPAVAPRAPFPPMAPGIPQPAQPPRAPQPPVAIFSPFSGQASAPAVAALDLESLKEGRSPRSYQLSPGKREAFYEMMSRNDVPILVQMEGDSIIIWGTDDEHSVFGRFVKIVDGRGQSRSGVAVSGLRRAAQAEADRAVKAAAESQRAAASLNGDKAALEQYRSTLQAASRDRQTALRAAEKAQAEAEVARERVAEQREREAATVQQRRELEAAANAMRSRSEALQNESRTTEQRVRELEHQIRQMEERAQRLEKQMDEQGRKPAKNKKTSAGPEKPDNDDVTSSNEVGPEPSMIVPESSTR